MIELLVKLFALVLLFGGGYLLMRFGMNMDNQLSLIIAFIAMPIFTFAVWFFEFRGRKFK
ncbi:MAG TPA: hypothetical protein VEK08_10380 [Planctomycetota bacterium]|nr:hypothetical protein [Planctomycetota bacterium]